MTTRKIDKSDWATYFDRVSRTLQGRRVTIEVTSLQLGDLIEGERLPLLGVTYDPKSEVIHVATQVLNHAIAAPQSVNVLEENDGLRAIEVTDNDGNKQLLQFSETLMLPTSVRAGGEAG